MGAPLRRDMDMIRDLLLAIEAGQTTFQLLTPDEAEFLSVEQEPSMSAELVEKTTVHLKLLADAQFVTLNRFNGGYWQVAELHWKGCDFIDSIRDPKIWRATKESAAKAGGFTVDLLKDIAKGLIKVQLKKHAGVELDL